MIIKDPEGQMGEQAALLVRVQGKALALPFLYSRHSLSVSEHHVKVSFCFPSTSIIKNSLEGRYRESEEKKDNYFTNFSNFSKMFSDG